MRGKAFPTSPDFLKNRITPAYAGKSENRGVSGRKPRDHPRLCGEKRICRVFLVLLVGSPPPMRGKGSLYLLISGSHGITPAYAGKRAKKSVMRSAGQDHPRLCGEKFMQLFPCLTQ